MYTIPAGEFKAKCLKIMDLIARNHEAYIITKRGIPIAKIIPIESYQDPFGFLKDTVKAKDDLVAFSLDENWEVETNDA